MPEIYDFQQPMTLTREHNRSLEMAFQTFSRQWGTMLSSRLGALTSFTLDAVEMRSYDDYIQSLPQVTTTVVIQVDPSRTPAILQIPNDATMTLIDCLLGGPATTLDMPFRELTDIEWKLMRDMLDMAVGELTYGLQPIAPMTFEVRSVKYNPHFIQLIPATEPVLVARFDMAIGPVQSQISLMFVAEALLSELRSADDMGGRSDEELREHAAALALMADRINEVPLPVAVRFRGRTMGAREVSQLEVGAVIPLHHPADRPLDVVVGDVVLAHAAIGVNGTRVACLVVSTEEEV